MSYSRVCVLYHNLATPLIREDHLPNRLAAMATDGQGVLLAVSQASDTRQRTTMDMLSRRVSHRLGCPVAVVQIQRGAPLLQAPLTQLAAKGVRSAVLVPVEPHLTTVSGFDATGELEYPLGGLTVRVRLAESIGTDPQLIEGVIEALLTSERAPDPHTAIVVALPASLNGAGRLLADRQALVTAAGWAGVDTVTVPATRDTSDHLDFNLTHASEQVKRALVVPLAVNPGPFVSRCAELVANAGRTVNSTTLAGGIEFAPITLHSTNAVSQLIKDRVTQARRAP